MLYHQATCLRRWARLPWVVQSGAAAIRAPAPAAARPTRWRLSRPWRWSRGRWRTTSCANLNPGGCRCVLDVGGGPGTWTLAWLKADPAVRAILFDLPHVVPLARTDQPRGLAEQVELVAGDFYVEHLPPPGARPWPGSAPSFTRTRRAEPRPVPPRGRGKAAGGWILIRDIVMEPSRTASTPAGVLFAVNMLAGTARGNTYTLAEIAADLATAGYRDVELIRPRRRHALRRPHTTQLTPNGGRGNHHVGAAARTTRRRNRRPRAAASSWPGFRRWPQPPGSAWTAPPPPPAGGPAPAPLPTIQLGKYRISRLVAGSNPILGYSYLGPHTDRHMKEYFTTERTVEFLQNCERAGITAHQFSDVRPPRRQPPPAPRARHEDAVHLPPLGTRQDPRRDRTDPADRHGPSRRRDRPAVRRGKSREVHDYRQGRPRRRRAGRGLRPQPRLHQAHGRRGLGSGFLHDLLLLPHAEDVHEGRPRRPRWRSPTRSSRTTREA